MKKKHIAFKSQRLVKLLEMCPYDTDFPTNPRWTITWRWCYIGVSKYQGSQVHMLTSIPRKFRVSSTFTIWVQCCAHRHKTAFYGCATHSVVHLNGRVDKRKSVSREARWGIKQTSRREMTWCLHFNRTFRINRKLNVQTKQNCEVFNISGQNIITKRTYRVW